MKGELCRHAGGLQAAPDKQQETHAIEAFGAQTIMVTSRQSHTSAAKRDAGVALAAVLTDLQVPGTFGGVDRLLTRQRTCRKEMA